MNGEKEVATVAATGGMDKLVFVITDIGSLVNPNGPLIMTIVLNGVKRLFICNCCCSLQNGYLTPISYPYATSCSCV
jgi:hypothetical protein